jgi:hypothetical protein
VFYSFVKWLQYSFNVACLILISDLRTHLVRAFFTPNCSVSETQKKKTAKLLTQAHILHILFSISVINVSTSPNRKLKRSAFFVYNCIRFTI